MSNYETTPWYNKGETGEYLRDWADCLLGGHGHPDWVGFARKCKRVGLTDAEVNQVLREEQESINEDRLRDIARKF